jgi:hypothetical protein
VKKVKLNPSNMEQKDGKNIVKNSTINVEGNFQIGDNGNESNLLKKPMFQLKKDMVRLLSGEFNSFAFPEVIKRYPLLPMQTKPKSVTPIHLPENWSTKTEDITGKTIQQIFDEFRREMLILGNPGMGKTTLMYELAIALIAIVEKDLTKAIPLVFNLSSWANFESAKNNNHENSRIFNWLIAEIGKYGITPKYAEELIRQKHICLLLDGLDEVNYERREECLTEINNLQQTYRLQIAISCRQTAYDLLKNQNKKLALFGAIELMPISENAITEFLQQQQLVELENAFRSSSILNELLTTPLWLNIAIAAFANQSDKLTYLDDLNHAKSMLLAGYERYLLLEKKVIEDRKIGGEYRVEDIQKWIYWLAEVMKKEDKVVFYLEKLQPTLLTKKQYKCYSFLAKNIFFLIGMVIFIPSTLLIAWFNNNPIIASFAPLLVWFVGEIIKRMIHGENYNSDSTIKVMDEIEVNNFKWNWELFTWRNLLKSVCIGWFLSVLMMCLKSWQGINTFLSTLIIWTIVSYVVIPLTEMISIMKMEETEKPNQGIFDLKKPIFACISTFLICTILVFLRPAFFGGQLNLILLIIPGITWLILELFGLQPILRHYFLRYLLYKKGVMPLNVIPFLEYATRLGFLKRIGGGYTFYHRELRDYLAQQKANNA